MPTIICDQPFNPCLDPSIPTANYSSEQPDRERCFSRFYYSAFPPLDAAWVVDDCVGRCEVEAPVVNGVSVGCDGVTTQDNGVFCAQREAVDCWRPPPDPDDPDDPNNPNNRFVVRTNHEQSCDFTCPDGAIFTYTIPAGSVSAFTQAEADDIAESLACNHAIDLRICIGELTPAAACVDVPYSGTCAITGPVDNYTITIVSGSLPPGIVFFAPETNDVAQFDGTPTTAGQFTITLRAEDADGNFMQKDITFSIVEILPATLADGAVGSPYNQAFSTNIGGGALQTWEIISGSLPPGITLGPFPASALLGTPTSNGSFTFTVRMTDPTL